MNGQEPFDFIMSLPLGKIWLVWDTLNNGMEHECHDGDVARALAMIEHSDSEKLIEWLNRITWDLPITEVAA